MRNVTFVRFTALKAFEEIVQPAAAPPRTSEPRAGQFVTAPRPTYSSVPLRPASSAAMFGQLMKACALRICSAGRRIVPRNFEKRKSQLFAFLSSTLPSRW